MKQQRTRLEEDSQAVRAVINSMGEGLISIDVDGLITAVNPYALAALGYSETELLGQWFTGMVIAVDKNKKPIDQLLRPIVRALTSGEAISEYAYYLRKDGSLMPVFLTVAPVLIDNRPAGAIELFRDVTRDQQLEIAKDEFVSLASHQLRTPASGVKAILSVLLDEDLGPLNGDQRRYLQKAVQGNNRQLQIIEDILNAARIDAGKMELEPELIDIADLVREAASEHTADFTLRGHTVDIQIPDNLSLWADKSKLHMVLDNLLSNASKYTQPGGNLTVRLDSSKDLVTISVSDTGIGIPEEDKARLFTKFSRIENELSTRVGGSGLGLYLVHNIVTLHHGTITVESVPGQGSTFTVALPVTLE